MRKFNFNFVVLFIVIIFLTIFITLKFTADNSLKQKVERLQKSKDSLDQAIKKLQNKTNAQDILILNTIKKSYQQIDQLSHQKKNIQTVINTQLNQVDSIINELQKSKTEYETIP
jgi:L-lactate utilization protein LutC